MPAGDPGPRPASRTCASARTRVFAPPRAASWAKTKSPRRRGSSIGYNQLTISSQANWTPNPSPKRNANADVILILCEFYVTPAPTQRHKRLVAAGVVLSTRSTCNQILVSAAGTVSSLWRRRPRIGGGRDRHARGAMPSQLARRTRGPPVPVWVGGPRPAVAAS